MDKDDTGLTGNSARDYQQRRYRSLDQAWVNWREQRIMARLLRHCQLARGTLLDIPCGYGRFAPLFARLGITAVGADANSDMVHLAAESHAAYGRGGWLRANIFDLPFAESTFDGALCIRLLHHRYSDVERRRILCELARVSRLFVVISFYRFTPVHALARHWRGTRGRLAMTTLLRLRELAQASGLQIQQVCSLMRFCHAQTFVVLTKNPPAGQASQPVYPNAL